jgi:hypothetical protein
MEHAARYTGYMVKIAYSAGGSDTTGLHTKEDALQRATAAVDQMRRDGSISCVTVRQWGDWDRDQLKYRCPPVFRVSRDDQIDL